MSSGDAVSVVISHVPAASCIHVPMLDTVDAIHRSRNTGIFSGAKPLVTGFGGTSVRAANGVSSGTVSI